MPVEDEHFFHAVLDALPAGVIVARDEDGERIVVYANPAAARAVDRPAGALVGAHLAALGVDGEAAHLGDAVVVVLGDRGAASEARLAEAQRIAHFGSWEWDMRSGEVVWSDELYRIYGVTRDEYSPSYEGYIARVHPDDREHVATAISRTVADGRPFSFEERIVRPDGTIRELHSGGGVVVDDDGVATKMVGACHDVTEREQTRRRLAEAQAELATRRLAEQHAKGITDGIIGSLVEAMQALDAGDERGAHRAMTATLEHASRMVTDLVGRPETT